MYLNEMQQWIDAMEAEVKRGRTMTPDAERLFSSGAAYDIAKMIKVAEDFTNGRARVDDIAFAIDESFDTMHLLGMSCEWANINGEATEKAEPWKILISILMMYYFRREHKLRVISFTDSFRYRRR